MFGYDELLRDPCLLGVPAGVNAVAGGPGADPEAAPAVSHGGLQRHPQQTHTLDTTPLFGGTASGESSPLPYLPAVPATAIDTTASTTFAQLPASHPSGPTDWSETLQQYNHTGLGVGASATLSYASNHQPVAAAPAAASSQPSHHAGPGLQQAWTGGAGGGAGACPAATAPKKSMRVCLA